MPSQARWLQASSENFIVYADATEPTLREFSEELELYHKAMERISGREVAPPSPSSRLTVFVVGNEREVRRLSGMDNPFVAGFYTPRASGPMAFVPEIRNRSDTHFSQIVLLHEYAHHFLISTGQFAMPRWLSEGTAEFYASAKFARDGTVMIGRPAMHRAGELFHSTDVTIQQLLDDELYQEQRGRGHDAYYGRAWLLFHYLTFEETRRGQLNSYWRKLIDGMPSLQAGEEAFGDLTVLERDLNRYLGARRMNQVTLQGLAGSPVTIRPLTDGDAAAMPLRMISKRGVNREQALELVPQYRALAAAHPDDGALLAALAEAEFDAGEDAAAIAAADRAIALDPTQVNAYVQKGYALFRQAEDAPESAAAYRAAMAPFQALNKLENDHPLPLIFLYRNYLQRGSKPSDLATQALDRALELAPYDQDLRMMTALQQASDGRPELARLTLQPVAFAPHGGGRSAAAGRLLAYLADHTDGEPLGMEPLMAAMQEPAGDDVEVASSSAED